MSQCFNIWIMESLRCNYQGKFNTRPEKKREKKALWLRKDQLVDDNSLPHTDSSSRSSSSSSRGNCCYADNFDLIEIFKLSLHWAFHPLKHVQVLQIEQSSFTLFTAAWTTLHRDNLEKLQQHNVFSRAIKEAFLFFILKDMHQNCCAVQSHLDQNSHSNLECPSCSLISLSCCTERSSKIEGESLVRLEVRLDTRNQPQSDRNQASCRCGNQSDKNQKSVDFPVVLAEREILRHSEQHRVNVA